MFFSKILLTNFFIIKNTFKFQLVKRQRKKYYFCNYPIMSMKKFNFCTTDLKTAKEKFVWTIKHFSEHEEKCGECLESTEFISKAPDGQILKWCMEIYPNGEKEEYKEYVSLYLRLIDFNKEEVKAKYQISTLKSNGDELVLLPIDKEWLKFSNSGFIKWGSRNMIKREMLLSEENGYLDGDQLTIECTVMVQQKLVEKASSSAVEIPECQALEDVSHLFEYSLFPDCKIISKKDDKEYKVHKCILGCRSRVFAAMFEHEMIEKNNNEVNIEDMKGNVIEKMLRFIYSGKEPDMDEGMAEELLKAADKYELIRLKLFCERKLINSLDSANACALLALANLYSAGNLKTQALDFIKAHLKEVMKSEGWTHADHQLKDQIFEAMQ